MRFFPKFFQVTPFDYQKKQIVLQAKSTIRLIKAFEKKRKIGKLLSQSISLRFSFNENGPLRGTELFFLLDFHVQ